jgi:hypothetical protein
MSCDPISASIWMVVGALCFALPLIVFLLIDLRK